MFDKREGILERMMVILRFSHGLMASSEFGGVALVDGEYSIFRNRGEVPDDKCPALVLLDGREVIRVSTSGKGGILTPTTFTLQPQVFVLLKQRENSSNNGVGPELSQWRMSLLKSFTSDEDLIAMLGSNGEIQYLGHETDLQTGSTMLGQMQMLFALTYVLNPGEY